MLDPTQAPDWLVSLFALFGRDVPTWLPAALAGIFLLVPLPFFLFFALRSRPRQTLVPPYRERVLLLGASSGVGRALALQYAARGCTDLVLVGRREAELEKVRQECEELRKKGEEWEMSGEAPGWEERSKRRARVIVADCTKPEDVLKIRDQCLEALEGIDTVHLLFGLAALRPILAIAGVDPIRKVPAAFARKGSKHRGDHASLSGLQAVAKASNTILEANIAATAMCATALLPLLQLSSASPAFSTLSSVAGLVPAPTRALYGASKAGQHMLLQGLALEAAAQAKAERSRAHVRFLHVLPGTIATGFRAGAVDGAPEESGARDSSWDQQHNSDVLTAEQVAEQTILAVDRQKEGELLMPSKYRFCRLGMALFPSRLAGIAHKKYEY